MTFDGWYVLDEDHAVRGPLPVDHPDVRAMFRSIAARRVAHTTLGPYRVSTVFLGFDHSVGYGPAQLFETMVFGPPPDEWADLLCRRYTTWDEAVEGHVAIVAEVIAHLAEV